MTGTTWTVREATADDRRQLVAVEHELFDPAGSLPAEWLFEHNPAGRGLVLVALGDDGRIAGTRAVAPWRLQVDGRETDVVQLTRTWTHPDFRGRGVSVAIGSELNRQIAERGFPMMFFFPSVRSMPGHRRIGNRLDPLLERRQQVTSVQFFRDGAPRFADGVLRAGQRMLARRIGSGRVRWEVEDDLPAAADRLWPDLADRPGVRGLRTADHIRWRFGEGTGREYGAWRFPAGGRPRFLAITRWEGRRGRIIDIWGEEADRSEAADAVAALAAELTGRSATMVEWCPPRTGFWVEAARGAGLLRRRVGVPLGRWFCVPEDTLGALADIERYRLTEGDSDYA